MASDESRLFSITGIGKKTAARMVLELKDKMKLIMPMIAPLPDEAVVSDDLEDVISALVNLGYKKPQAEETVRKVRHAHPGLAVKDQIREALSMLMKR
jgi:Holliday junction DNA helicase RuvA